MYVSLRIGRIALDQKSTNLQVDGITMPKRYLEGEPEAFKPWT